MKIEREGLQAQIHAAAEEHLRQMQALRGGWAIRRRQSVSARAPGLPVDR